MIVEVRNGKLLMDGIEVGEVKHSMSLDKPLVVTNIGIELKRQGFGVYSVLKNDSEIGTLQGRDLKLSYNGNEYSLSKFDPREAVRGNYETEILLNGLQIAKASITTGDVRIEGDIPDRDVAAIYASLMYRYATVTNYRVERRNIRNRFRVPIVIANIGILLLAGFLPGQYSVLVALIGIVVLDLAIYLILRSKRRTTEYYSS
ncbi:hypothetical protein HS7_12420 [Sulfolobales archaeon HS-7]|nr:hypothetical protein HS7_12420 [Sulfolobales archaeon HS-7]